MRKMFLNEFLTIFRHVVEEFPFNTSILTAYLILFVHGRELGGFGKSSS